MATALAVALSIGARGDQGPRTLEQRVQTITERIRCPTCRSQSVANSDAPAAVFIRGEVRDRLRAGQSEDQILAYVFSRYGQDIRLEPDTGGVAGLVWLLPALGVAVAVGALALAFRRWASRPGAAVSADDRARVEEALRS
jgi:cytochrome c-type biogenesis protein CcmH